MVAFLPYLISSLESQGLFLKWDRGVLPQDYSRESSCYPISRPKEVILTRNLLVWCAILSQLSLWINANAEDVRGKFDAHEGKKELKVTFVSGNRYSVDNRVFAEQVAYLIEKNVVDPQLRKWMMPTFTTTTNNDTVIASILMMGSMQKYFDYKCQIDCGLPFVTLLGEKADWKLVLEKLEKLKTFGEEPTQFYELLKPIISRFVKSFDEPTSADTIGFWQRIAHFIADGSDPSYYSGWITAFCFWDGKGKCMYRAGLIADTLGEGYVESNRLCLDGVEYHQVESEEVPLGYTSVPVRIDDQGDEFGAMMVAGSVGIKATSSGDSGAGAGLDTMSATTAWWMFEKKKESKGESYIGGTA